MSMFPTAGSHIYRNEEGEVLGWSDETQYEPEYCDECGFNHSGECPPEPDDEDDEDDEDPFYGDDFFTERGL